MKTLIAIDPGASGGIAHRYNGCPAKVVNMPESQPDIFNVLKAIRDNAGDCVCAIEQIPLFISPDLPSSTIAVLFENYGYTKGVLQALGVPTYTVQPSRWMKEVGLGTKGTQRAPSMPKGATPEQRDWILNQRKLVKAANAQAKRDWKAKLKAEAQRRFPYLPVTLKTCDALLLLEWAKAQPFAQ